MSVLNFKNWMFQEAFGSFQYNLPTNKSQQMADFYVLQMLLGRTSFDLKRQQIIADKGVDSYEFGKPRSIDDQPNKEDQLDYILKEITNQLLPQLKKEILDDVLFAICAEFRHVIDRNKSEKIIYLAKEIGPEYEKIVKNYFKYYIVSSDSSHKSFFRRVKNTHEKNPVSPTYLVSYKAYLNSKATPQQMISLAKYMFLEADWTSSYGGEAWAKICEAWEHLNESKTSQSMFVYIDHIYDIQHNTGTVFNKLSSYRSEDNGHSWISVFLDKKAKMNNPLELYDEVSSSIRKILPMAAKFKFGTGLEDFIKKKERFLNIKNNNHPHVDATSELSFLIKSRYEELNDWLIGKDNMIQAVLAIYGEKDNFEKFSDKDKKTVIASVFDHDFVSGLREIEKEIEKIEIFLKHVIGYWGSYSVTLKSSEVKNVKKLLIDFNKSNQGSIFTDYLNGNFYNMLRDYFSRGKTVHAVKFIKDNLGVTLLAAKNLAVLFHRELHYDNSCRCLTDQTDQVSYERVFKEILNNPLFKKYNYNDSTVLITRALSIFRLKSELDTETEQTVFDNTLHSLNMVNPGYIKILTFVKYYENIMHYYKINLGTLNLSDDFYKDLIKLFSLSAELPEEFIHAMADDVLGLTRAKTLMLLGKIHIALHNSNSVGLRCRCKNLQGS